MKIANSIQYDYKVVSSQLTTPTTLVLTLHRDSQAGGLNFQAGQYAAISFSNHHRPTPARCFSITSSPMDAGWLQFAMRIGGDFTKTAARRIKAGDTVSVEGPFGGFILRPYRDYNMVLLAGGIGITPFMSILRYAAKVRIPNDILLVYSCKSQDDIPFLNDILALEQQNPHLHVVFAISAGPTDKLAGRRVARGRVTEQLLNQVLGGVYEGRSYFLCGPQPFMDTLLAVLRQRRVPKRRIISESFSQNAPETNVLIGRPSQIYIASALSLVLGTAMVMEHEVSLAGSLFKNDDNLAQAGLDGNGNSRQGVVDQAIGGLQGGGDSNGNLSAGGGVMVTDPSDPAYGTFIPASGSDTQVGGPGTTGPSNPSNPSLNPGSSPTPNPASPPSASPNPRVPAVAPILSLSASRTVINRGESLVLSWQMMNRPTEPVVCTASRNWSGVRAVSGSETVAPTSNATYVLVCENAGGTSTRFVTVTVNQPTIPTIPPPAPTPTPTPPPPTPAPTPTPVPPPKPPPTPPPSSGGS